MFYVTVLVHSFTVCTVLYTVPMSESPAFKTEDGADATVYVFGFYSWANTIAFLLFLAQYIN